MSNSLMNVAISKLISVIIFTVDHQIDRTTILKVSLTILKYYKTKLIVKSTFNDNLREFKCASLKISLIYVIKTMVPYQTGSTNQF